MKIFCKMTLAIAFVTAGQNVLACSGVSSAHCNYDASYSRSIQAGGQFSGQPSDYTIHSLPAASIPNQCYNQQTQNQKCLDDITSNLNSGVNILQNIKDAAIQNGFCEEVASTVKGSAGSNTMVNKSLEFHLNLGGTWHSAIAAVPASCPVGYSFPGPVGPYCVIDIAPITIDDVVEVNATKPNARVKQKSTATSAVDAADTSANGLTGRKKLTCTSGYILTDAGYKPEKVCRKQTSANPGSQAVAAHCTSLGNN